MVYIGESFPRYDKYIFFDDRERVLECCYLVDSLGKLNKEREILIYIYDVGEINHTYHNYPYNIKLYKDINGDLYGIKTNIGNVIKEEY